MQNIIEQQTKIIKGNPLDLNILKVPYKYLIKAVLGKNREYELVNYVKKKITMQVHSLQMLKSKLLSTLETYQWRCKTQFPIVKTYFVELKTDLQSLTNTIKFELYIEHHNLRLNEIFHLTTGQALYILKQCIIGFQRLINRFGGFEINQKMICINEKGLCRVWINENYQSNKFKSNNLTEAQTVNQIINLIEAHCLQSKASKRLFTLLKQSNSFITVLKAIDFLALTNKIVLPSRYTFRKETNNNVSPLKYTADKNKSPIKFTSEKLIKMNSNLRISLQKKQKYLNTEKSLESFSQKNSPLEIKRFQSEEKINFLKTSNQQTNYTLAPKRSSNIGSNNGVAEKKSRKNQWIEDNSFMMDDGGKCEKKQMSHSSALELKNSRGVLNEAERKFSINVNSCKNNLESFLTRFKIREEQEPHQNYFDEFQSILQDNQPAEQIEQHPWQNCFQGLTLNTKQLRQSIHSGVQENLSPQRNIKLQKLDGIAKRGMAMSILHEEVDDSN